MASPNRWPIVSNGPTASREERPVVRDWFPTTPGRPAIRCRRTIPGPCGSYRCRALRPASPLGRHRRSRRPWQPQGAPSPAGGQRISACFSCLRHVIPALQFGRILHRSRDSPKSKTSVTLTGLLDNVGLEIPGAQPRHRVELLGVESFEEFGLGVDLVGELGQELAQAVGRVGVAASGHR